MAFDKILDLARCMDVQAAEGNWVAVGATEHERDSAIHAFFATPAAAHEATWIASGIREILEIDQRIMGLARQRMSELSGDIGDIRKGRQAQQAYESNGGLSAHRGE